MTIITPTRWSGRQFIDGRWQSAAGETLENRNPARVDEVIGLFPRGTKADVDLAVAAARRAFVPWRRTSRIHRGELFGRLANLIADDVDQLATLLATESGKVLDEARAEVVEGLHMVQYVFGTARQPIGTIAASEIVGKDLYVRRKPRGVVAVITPWNFPFAVPLWMLAPSLLEGNTVVFKPSEETPAIGEHLVRLFDEAGFPPGTINLVHGLGEEVGEALAAHADVDVVCFTGSYAVGSRIRQLAAESDHKTCAIEAGSKSAVIVCEDAPLDLACDAAILSAFKTTGQRCVSAGRVLVHARLFDAFAARFVQAGEAACVSPIRSIGRPSPGRSSTKRRVEKVTYYNQLAVKEGAEVLLDGGRMTDPEHGNGYFMSPFVYRQRHGPDVRTIREEVFGPHVALIPFDDDDEAIRIYNDTPYGLSMAVITEIIAAGAIIATNATTAWATSICRASGRKCICRSAA